MAPTPADLLLSKGYEVQRIIRRTSTFNRVFFSDLTREPLQYLIRSHFTFHM